MSSSSSAAAPASSPPADMHTPPIFQADNPDLVERVLHRQGSNPALLTPPVDPSVALEPADVARPRATPRRMSISDTLALQQALKHAFSNDGAASRPNSPVGSRRTHTRFLVPTAARDQPHTETFALDFAPASDQLAAGCGDGSVRLFATGPGVAGHRMQAVLQHADDKEHLPATCVRFSPAAADADGSRVLLASYADGSVTQWRVGGQGQGNKVLHTVSPGGSSNSIYALAFQSDGLHFAAAGRDHLVRLYDSTTGTLVRTFENSGSHGHSNRVYALKFHPRDAHTLMSGGVRTGNGGRTHSASGNDEDWDNTIQIWDDRTGYSVRSIFGPHICGDALDANVAGTEILTGSWREENALQKWDYASGKLIANIPWNTDASSSAAGSHHHQPHPSCMLYAASYSPDGSMIAAGGAGNGLNQAKLFDAASGAGLERVTLAHGLYTLSFSADGKQLALGGVDPALTIVNL